MSLGPTNAIVVGSFKPFVTNSTLMLESLSIGSALALEKKTNDDVNRLNNNKMIIEPLRI